MYSLSKNGKNMEKYHGIRPHEDFPYNASLLGFTIQDRNLATKRNSELGIRENLIPFQFLGDELPPDSKSATWDETSIPGRFEPIKHYSQSNSTEISLKLIYVALGTKKRNHKTFWTIENIEILTQKLKSLVFPNYNPKYESPKTVLLNMGSIFIDLPLKIKNITILHKAPHEISDLTGRIKEISVEATVSYPIYQSITAKSIFFSEEGNKIFAYKKFSRTNI